MFIGEFRKDVRNLRIIICTALERLESPYFRVRENAIGLLSRLGVQGMCSRHFLVGVLKHLCS